MPQKRVARRHNLALPVILSELPQKPRMIHGTTRDISTHGFYFTTDLSVKNGLSLEFSFTLPADIHQENEATIAGMARVVRVERLGSGSNKIGVAVAIESFKVSAL